MEKVAEPARLRLVETRSPGLTNARASHIFHTEAAISRACPRYFTPLRKTYILKPLFVL